MRCVLLWFLDFVLPLLVWLLLCCHKGGWAGSGVVVVVVVGEAEWRCDKQVVTIAAPYFPQHLPTHPTPPSFVLLLVPTFSQQ